MESFISYEAFYEMVEDILYEVPDDFFHSLNLGVVLEEEAKLSDYSQNQDLWISGQYSVSQLGRQIKIFYGSYAKLYPHHTKEALRPIVEETIYHEFTHHLESLAGEKGLEVKDEKFIQNYLKRYQKK